MYVEIDFNLLYQLEQIAQREKRSVTEVVNEAVAQYVERQFPQSAAGESDPAPDDA